MYIIVTRSTDIYVTDITKFAFKKLRQFTHNTISLKVQNPKFISKCSLLLSGVDSSLVLFENILCFSDFKKAFQTTT